MDATRKNELARFAQEIRVGALEAFASRGFGHAGGALSVADLLAVLYGDVLRIDPQNPAWPQRDKLVCSKGHAGPAIYAALALKGYFPYEMLKTLNQPGTRLPSHCDRNKTPGIDATTGSLGQGASQAVGIALGDRLKGRDSRTYLILGDGEANEGQVWEAMMFAAANRLDNLTVLLDYNKKQLDGRLETVLDTLHFVEKFRAFGLESELVAGGDVEAIGEALNRARQVKGRPQAIVLDTVKGAGVPEIEAMEANHNVTVPSEKWEEWLAQSQEALALLRQGEVREA